MKILDVNAALQGDVASRFEDYSLRSNLDLIAGSYSQVPFLKDVPRAQVEAIARHPEGMLCRSGSSR